MGALSSCWFDLATNTMRYADSAGSLQQVDLWVPKPSVPVAVTNTSGASLATIEAHLNSIKAVLRTGGLLAPTGSTAPEFVTGVTAGTPRNDFGGEVGMKITVGATPITIQALGRWVIAGNSQTHQLRVRLAASPWTELATSTVDTVGATAGDFVYADLGSSLGLSANTSYIITSAENSGGDQFYNDNATVTHTAVATVPNAIYQAGPNYLADGSADHAFCPLSFRYT